MEDEIFVDQVDSPEIVDDFELGQEEVVDIKDKHVNKMKLKRRVSQYKVCGLTELHIVILGFEFVGCYLK